MFIEIKDELLKIESLGLLDALLQDKTTSSNIIWATDAYAQYGEAYQQDREILSVYITSANYNIIKTRVRKELEEQSARTKQHAEVFTPMWVCNMMNDYIDEMWSEERGDLSEKNWREYVDSRILEITCGEAPFLVSRYDASTGDAIPIDERIGILDRKLKVVDEFAETDQEWLKWAVRAFQTTYGYEFQGDNVLIARVNLLMTYEEYFVERFGRKPGKSQYKKIVDIIAWNIWQMDGLSGGIPFSRTEGQQLDIFDMLNGSPQTGEKVQSFCKVYDWKSRQFEEYKTITERNNEMRFDYIIGNPPYQEETESDSTRMPPIYNLFMEGAYKVSGKVELITPARFLFNAGFTPKAWNDKMLNDEHFKVLSYMQNSGDVFPGTDIKGGVAISYRDESENYGCIGTFTVYDEMNSILNKVKKFDDGYLDSICYPALSYGLTPKAMKDFPDSVGRLRTSAFTKLSDMFLDDAPDDGRDYIKMLGLLGNRRIVKYVRREYIKTPDNFEYFKVFIAKSNGSGALGETLSNPIVGEPMLGATQTFISIGKFETSNEAEACLKYVKTKFVRTMLGILKVTQDNPPEKWRYVPMQDFASKSDIDWTKSVPEIDNQLYKKYGLDESEIAFIEKNIKAME